MVKLKLLWSICLQLNALAILKAKNLELSLDQERIWGNVLGLVTLFSILILFSRNLIFQIKSRVPAQEPTFSSFAPDLDIHRTGALPDKNLRGVGEGDKFLSGNFFKLVAHSREQVSDDKFLSLVVKHLKYFYHK